MSAKFRAWVHGLAVTVLVALCSFGLIVQPMAASADALVPSPGAVVKAGVTKTLPARLLVCANPVLCLTLNTVGAGAMWWLMDTESGAKFRSDVWNRFMEPFRGSGARGTYCTAVPTVAWSMGVPTITLEATPVASYPSPHQGLNPCLRSYGDFGKQSFHAQISVQCRKPDGSTTAFISRGGGSLDEYPWTPTGVLCAEGMHAAGVEILAPGAASHAVIVPGWFPNPLDAAWQLLDEDTAVFRTSIRCQQLQYPNGSTTVTRDSEPGAGAPVAASCPPGYVPTSQTISTEREAGSGNWYPLHDMALAAGAATQYKQCVGAGSSGCVMDVFLDGVPCYFGREGCEDWWSISQAAPDRVNCQWGPYSLAGADCEPIRHAYVTPEGAHVDPALPPSSMPQPTLPNPGDGGGEPDPTLNPDLCPNSGSPHEAGLKPTALKVLRCAVFEYPWLTPTSGLRVGSEYDHGSGDAVDLAPPNWDTPLGRDRGWTTAHWLVANATALDVTYVIFADMRWPAYDGSLRWVPYQHPSGYSDPSSRHLDHVHVSARGRTATQPQPGEGQHPVPAPPVTANPPGFPSDGTNPDPGDGTDCLDGAWNWNPVSWVYTPVKCALLWAFVPPEDSDPFAGASAALDGTTVGEWVSAPGDVMRAVAGIGGVSGPAGFDQVILGGGSDQAISTAVEGAELGGGMGTMGAGDCTGPDLTMTTPELLGSQQVTINPFNACAMPMQFMAALLHSSLELSVWLGAFIASLNTISSAFGLQSQIRAAAVADLKAAS